MMSFPHPFRVLCAVIALLAFGACTDILPADPGAGKSMSISGRLIYTEATEQGGTQVISINADSTNAIVVSSTGEMFTRPQNGKIVFVENRMGGGNLVIADADGNNPLTIPLVGFDGMIEPATVVLSPDGTSVAFAFTSKTGGLETHLAVVSTNGNGFDILTDRFNFETSPVFSPDGKKLAMYLYSDDYDISSSERLVDLVIVTVANNQIRTTDTLDRGFYGVNSHFATLDWTEDGKQLLYHTEDSLYLYDADLQRSRFLGFGTQGSFSPDEQSIAFTIGAYEIMRNSDLYVMNVDGSSRRRLTETPSTFEVLPAWSPDGNWILVGAYSDQSQAEDIAQLHAINVVNPQEFKRYGNNVWRGFWLE